MGGAYGRRGAGVGPNHRGYATIGLVSYRSVGGQVRRAAQVLGIALMTAGLLVDSSQRSRSRRAGRTSDSVRMSRLPLLLFWIGTVLLVVSSI